MATSGRLDTRHVVDATEDLTGDENKFVTLAGALAGAGARGYPLKEGNESGRGVTIQLLGKSKVILGGTVTAGAALASDASGLAVTATAGDAVNAIALAGGAANAVVPVLLVAYKETA